MFTKRTNPDSKSHWLNRVALYVVVGLVGYVLSSGPVLGLAFWLREATHNDYWYMVMWVYFPVLVLGHRTPLMWYIEWWVVDVFHTVGPG
ncbi:hypothetical protein NG895_05830 [Aeoliella sp. ICT_H6.2]|uniref:Uncharacterized protein n=1 Tax=Aeoliella straminimaris TaxID=2954799 RepID=A0A9X2JEW2_9BACT|nr:hypothetical protein [Aeoliella straminimaris]MCO6043420.1 hypothetical protein [Aeoliella straminimaris]